MRDTKRPRACDACHSIKIKCELGSTGGPGPCERCVRLGKDCIVTPPKSQKDRVAELEAQVAALTKLLERQDIDGHRGDSTLNRAASGPLADQPSPHDVPQKKRKFIAEGSPSNQLVFPQLDQLDQIVPLDLQKRLVEKYAHAAVPLVPVVPLPDGWTFEQLRETHPVLFQTIIYSMSTGSLPEPEQDKLGSIMLNTLEALAKDEGKKSVELLQAIQIAVLWYRAPKNHRQVAAFQLAQRAAAIAEDIGLWGSQKSSSIGFATVNGGADPAASLRAWQACHLLSTAIVVLMRKPSYKSLPELDNFSLHMLEYLDCAQKTDRIVCHFVRGEALCEQIATDMKLFEVNACLNVSDLATQLSIQTFQNSIIDWKTQIPMSPVCLPLRIYEHMATLYLHEALLHTPTNKHSFAAPFLAERLSMTDFPAPIIVTEQHVASMNALKDAAHAVFDLFATFDLDTWLTLPFILFIGRVAYAEYILAKLYIATTAPGNTFGAFLDPDSLQVERCLDQLMQAATLAQQVDSSCPAARILLAPARLKEWLTKYNVSNGLISAGSDYGSKEVTPTVPDEAQFDWDISDLAYTGADWELDGFLKDPNAWDFFSAP